MAPILLLPLGLLLAAALGAGLFASRRQPFTRLSRVFALAPLSAFLLLVSTTQTAINQELLTWSAPWLPSLDITVGLYFDGLSALFALLITGIGTLVVLYTGEYFSGDPTGWRFLAFLLLFTFAMLGLVMAGDLISLFIFWEGTSLTSFLLVGFKSKDPVARRGAFKALFITAGGGVALLLGFLIVAGVAGGSTFEAVLGGGDLLRGSPYYPAMLALILVGAFTKSAQYPFHFWLPEAMSAPTPASAFLHSATMVKAGIYLLARLNPVLGFTEAWFWSLSLVGLATMLVGAYLGLKQDDLKALLAYSTISQLGVLVALIGQDTSIAFKGLVIGVLAHALYKSALFLIVGGVDQAAGTRHLGRLGGLRRTMPVSFSLSLIAGLSMAGLPPLFGFLAKETLLATATHPTVPPVVDLLFPAAAVIAGALLLAQTGLLVWDTFLGPGPPARARPREVSAVMLLAPAVPAVLSLSVGLLPEPEPLARFLAGVAEAAYGAPVRVSLALWTGINVPLILSLVAVTLGTLLFLRRHEFRAVQERLSPTFTLAGAFRRVLAWVDRIAFWATRLQAGPLRVYLVLIVVSVGALVGLMGGLPSLNQVGVLSMPSLDLRGEIIILRAFALLVTLAGSTASVLLRRDMHAVVALGVTGMGLAVWMILEPAPDVALVQILVDILAMVVLVLALTRLPRAQRRRARRLNLLGGRAGLVRDLVLAAGSGLVVASATLLALTSRPRESLVTPFYEANAKVAAGATDIVGAILVDFRALDTLIEITVFSMAGLGVFALLRFAARRAGDQEGQLAELPPPVAVLSTLGIGGTRASPLLNALASIALPLALVVAVLHMMYGHDQPGDGFTAGVIVGLAIAFWYVIFGYAETRRRLAWFRGVPLIASGLILVLLSAAAAWLLNDTFFSPVDFGAGLNLPAPAGFKLSTAFLFEVAIFLSILGSLAFVLDGLGHPGRGERESLPSVARMRIRK